MAKKQKLTDEDIDLLAELGIEFNAKSSGKYTNGEERIIAGFEEIQNFVKDFNCLPQHGESRGIFERLYAVRLDQIRKKKECIDLLSKFDYQGILENNLKKIDDQLSNLNDSELLAELGININDERSITDLKHVKPRAEKKAAEEIANRIFCKDFEQFKELFEGVKSDLDKGYRKTIQFRKDAGFTKTTLKLGQYLILGGQMAFIAQFGESFKAPNGEDDARLRVIYDNGTENNILLRSLIRAMYKDESSRFITELDLGPLFSSEINEDDYCSGTIYILRSLSKHPLVQEHKEIFHKIGVTSGDLKKRLANAKNDPTFLMDDIEIVAKYELANINPVKLENIIHRFFSKVRLEIEIIDRFGRPVKAREWFLVPIFIIDEMVDKIRNGSISYYYYDPKTVSLKRF